jgi:hypothetical protein
MAMILLKVQRKKKNMKKTLKRKRLLTLKTTINTLMMKMSIFIREYQQTKAEEQDKNPMLMDKDQVKINNKAIRTEPIIIIATDHKTKIGNNHKINRHTSTNINHLMVIITKHILSTWELEIPLFPINQDNYLQNSRVS